jgi:hypothetical protein
MQKQRLLGARRQAAAAILDASIRTRSPAERTLSTTSVPGRVNLNAFCSRLEAAEYSNCRSALIASCGSEGDDSQEASLPRLFEVRRDLELGDEAIHRDRLGQGRDRGREAHVGERAIDEVAKADQAPVEDRRGGAVQSDGARLDRREGQDRRC